ncbi:aminodeoxychorismate synthase component I [Chitinimonas koreensis]|uniref:aminodeoxychorismate synthase component I n=1 Tax=Chitinimonas koreensis TaxID=356302 RepID=UPI00041ED240|nr:aminodeoxychorismate synthase component I [Chitinimonas koreensis]QNM97837.1 aminodeoxychorismate synthase component I [Chitinimonas koreensis]
MPTLSLPSAPDLLALAAAYPADFPYLLQSAGDTGWDILFALPESVRIYGAGEGAALQRDLAAIAVAPAADASGLPFTGGWFTYLGYEWLETLESTVPPRHDAGFPLGLLARVPAALIVAREDGRATLVAETADQLARLEGLLAGVDAPFAGQPIVLAGLTEDEPQAFLDGTLRCKQYIRDGDVFQVNLSRGWDAQLAGGAGPLDLFAQLRRANPAPFSAYVDFGDGRAIVSSSPERLARIDRTGRVETRPIAGTHPRSPDPAEDAAQKARLIASTKERAEHIMLIDLERNDLGRIARPGTVRVDALMDVTSYTYVHHIESTVSCTVRPGLSVADAVRALFPGGTITGCPKVRCMQIIRELEDRPRRAYTGSLGYINRDGSLDLNILIRTFMQDGAALSFRAGAGIVADSDPERELGETRAKARGLLRALGLADR